MARDLITTNEAASVLEVGTSTVKRWADEGRLQCLKTAGGHRRFYRSEVLAMRGSSAAIDADLSPKRILEDLDGHATLGALMHIRSLRGSWWSVATELGNLLEQIGEDWRAGTLSVVQEHVISERLLRSLHTVCQSIPLSSSAPICLLVMANGDEHTLGLRLAELTAREAGWQSLWVGSKTPLRELERALQEPLVQALAVSASRYCGDTEKLASEAEALAAIATGADLPLALGGQGHWPDAPRYGVRVKTLLDFREFLHQSASNSRFSSTDS